MPSHLRRAVEALGISPSSGPSLRAIALGSTSLDGVTLGALGGSGSWARRLAQAMGRTTGDGGWLHRVAAAYAGDSSEAQFEALCGGGSSDPPPPPAGFAYLLSGTQYVAHGGALVITPKGA